jgi:hypothetical protein
LDHSMPASAWRSTRRSSSVNDLGVMRS